MKAESIEVRHVALPLVTPFVTGNGAWDRVAKMLVHVLGPDGDGWGECPIGIAPDCSPGSFEEAETRLAGLAFGASTDALPAVGPGPDRAVRCALETALLDADLRVRGVSLAVWLGATRSRVEVGVVVGLGRSIDSLLDEVRQRLDEGYRRVKLKIAPGWDVEPVTAVRQHFPNATLMVDGNEGYSVADTDVLARLDGLGLLMIEQPLPADDLAGHAALAGRLRTPICLDESITSADAARRALDSGACAIVAVKPARLGGLLEARRVHDVCAQRGVPLWCGGMLESGVGRAAVLALAGLPGFTFPADLSASDRYFAADLTEPFALEDGCLPVPAGPGIGVAVVPGILDEMTVSSVAMRPGAA
jgi:O-succinylbenzoate synthase